jgi:hypothetical protein
LERANVLSNDFAKFVDEQSREPIEDSQERIKSKERWLKNLNELYDNIRNYLHSFVESGQINIMMEPLTLNEELLGAYDVEKMFISIGSRDIELLPIGTFLIGAWGRVDMIGPYGTQKIALVQRNTKIMQIKFNNNDSKSQNSSAESLDLVWKIIISPLSEYVDLNQVSFTNAILKVAQV